MGLQVLVLVLLDLSDSEALDPRLNILSTKDSEELLPERNDRRLLLRRPVTAGIYVSFAANQQSRRAVENLLADSSFCSCFAMFFLISALDPTLCQ